MQMLKNEASYLSVLEYVRKNGVRKEDRTGVGTLSCHGMQMRFDLSDGFPLLTTKKVHMKSIVHELLWFLSGDTNVKYLKDNKVRIWDEWATAEQTAKFSRPEGELGPIYGHQWRNFGATQLEDGSYANDGVDQIARVIEQIKTDPNSRRLIVTGWNPAESDKVTLPPCHTLFQFLVTNGKLSCHLTSRALDLFLGAAFNAGSYATLISIIARICDLEPGELIITAVDCHIYLNHLDQVDEQLSREILPPPKLRINPELKDIADLKYEDIELIDYQSHPAIKAPVAV